MAAGNLTAVIAAAVVHGQRGVPQQVNHHVVPVVALLVALQRVTVQVQRHSLSFGDCHPFRQRDVARQLDADGAAAAERVLQRTFRRYFGLRPGPLRDCQQDGQKEHQSFHVHFV